MKHTLKENNTLVLTPVDTAKVPLEEVCIQGLMGGVMNVIYS